MAYGFPKPEPHKKYKARKKQRETKVIRTVRPQVVDRDGYCRLRSARESFQAMFGACDGPSEWAHWMPHSRAKTMGMEPEVRHTVDKSMMLCKKHHEDYDQNRLEIEALTDRICDGLLRFKNDEHEFEETE